MNTGSFTPKNQEKLSKGWGPLLSAKHDQGTNLITSAFGTFENQFHNLGNNLELIQKVYLIQCSAYDHFDYGGRGLLKILEKDSKFLIEYVSSLYKDEKTYLTGSHEQLGILWAIADIETRIDEVIHLITQKENYYGILEDFSNVFFRKIPEEFDKRALRYLYSFLENNFQYPRKMNMLVDIAHNSRPEIFENILLKYLHYNNDVDAFAKIHWQKDVGTQMGQTIFGDLWAEEWVKVKDIVYKSDLGTELIPIKKHINNRIDEYRVHAEHERQHRFIRGDDF